MMLVAMESPRVLMAAVKTPLVPALFDAAEPVTSLRKAIVSGAGVADALVLRPPTIMLAGPTPQPLPAPT